VPSPITVSGAAPRSGRLERRDVAQRQGAIGTGGDVRAGSVSRFPER